MIRSEAILLKHSPFFHFIIEQGIKRGKTFKEAADGFK